MNSRGLRYVPPKTDFSSGFEGFSPNAPSAKMGTVRRKESIIEMVFKYFIPKFEIVGFPKIIYTELRRDVKR
jgi:hypothetical protein